MDTAQKGLSEAAFFVLTQKIYLLHFYKIGIGESKIYFSGTGYRIFLVLYILCFYTLSFFCKCLMYKPVLRSMFFGIRIQKMRKRNFFVIKFVHLYFV